MKSSSLNISIKDVTKTYENFYALKNIDLEVTSGEFLTLLGPSGSGKTTLLMVLAGFTSPDYGSVKFGEEEVVLKPPHLRDIGMVFQNYALFPHMNVEQNVGYPQKLRGINKTDMKKTVDEALATVKLDGLGHRGVSELSGGQRQRVALARLLRQQPLLVLADEPLSALDPVLAEEVMVALLDQAGCLVSLHRPDLVHHFDRVIGLRQGRLVLDASSGDVRSDAIACLYQSL